MGFCLVLVLGIEPRPHTCQVYLCKFRIPPKNNIIFIFNCPTYSEELQKKIGHIFLVLCLSTNLGFYPGPHEFMKSVNVYAVAGSQPG
jgi:hypothetical protein